MSSTDNTKMIGLAWPDDRQGSICSLTPLVLSTSATSSVADLHSQRALITSEVEVHLGNSPSASAAAGGATDTSSGKAAGHYKKNPNTKQLTDNHRHVGTTTEMIPNETDSDAAQCTGGTPPEYYGGFPLVRTWSNPTLYEGGFMRHPFSGSEMPNHPYNKLQGACCDR